MPHARGSTHDRRESEPLQSLLQAFLAPVLLESLVAPTKTEPLRAKMRIPHGAPRPDSPLLDANKAEWILSLGIVGLLFLIMPLVTR